MAKCGNYPGLDNDFINMKIYRDLEQRLWTTSSAFDRPEL